MSEDPAWWDRLGPRFHAAIRAAEQRGQMTYKELDAVMPGEECTSKQIESLLEYLDQKGIALIEDDL